MELQHWLEDCAVEMTVHMLEFVQPATVITEKILWSSQALLTLKIFYLLEWQYAFSYSILMQKLSKTFWFTSVKKVFEQVSTLTDLTFRI